ncbi:Hsp20/alpha crystallin family protein [Caldimonas brevitalea]|uniref:HSP20 family protein n=1 Tax=Caldimonas brevitalea TaxID=413882 RepID=A0A0G3BPC4_9BURK|nr:Hsp20/alpha crystallin family protein [Caldimonas brevitalea]AKJ28420.1 HSP20 family protein [Caldimonas brevitalea]
MFVMPVSRSAVLRPELARAFDRFMADTRAAVTATSSAAQVPALDVVETDAAYLVTVDLPGVAKENVKLTVEGKRVQLEAEEKVEGQQGEAQRLVYRERAPRKYARSFTLPVAVAVEQSAARASLDKGVLTLTLPKVAAHQPVQIAVN